MYTLCLDLHLRFVPPMNEHAAGTVLTRTLELPFPPYSGLAIHGADLDECEDPLGLQLQDVIWDMNRGVFLAHTIIVSHDEPLAFIPDTLRAWVHRGWTLGSYRDAYSRGGEHDADDEVEASDANDAEFDRLEKLHTLPKNRRDRAFNQFFRALIRQMSDGYNNLDVAYAMDQLGRLLDDEEPRAGQQLSETARLWRAALHEFGKLNDDAQWAWRDKVAKYPSLDQALGIRRRR